MFFKGLRPEKHKLASSISSSADHKQILPSESALLGGGLRLLTRCSNTVLATLL